jgi:uncharacterized protein with HEPN domain
LNRDPRLFLDDILEAIKKIDAYRKSLTFQEFSEDDKTVDAVVRNFEILAEAAKHIPSEIKRKYPQVPWRQMAGTRDKLIHVYFGVNLKVLWKAMNKDVPSLKPKIEEMLRKMDENPNSKL